jgi:RHS repeat-associated protein
MGTRKVTWTYGPKGELQATRDPEGNVTRFRADAFGRIVERRGPMGDIRRTRYDLLGRPVEVIRADGARILNVRDAGGNVVEIRDADGGVARSVYGFCGRLLAFTDTLGNATRVEWGTEPKRLMAIRNAKGEEYRFAYDADGNRVSHRDFAGRETKLKYNAAGNAVSATNAMGEKITYLRDAASRLLGMELSDGTALAYEYDDSDYLLSASGPDGSLAFKRDKLGRTLREEGAGFWIEYAYDADGSPMRTATSLGMEIGYGLDARGYLSAIGIDGAPFLSMTRNAAGAETLRTLPGPFRLEQQVDPSGRLHRQQVFPGAPGSTVFGKPVIDREYAWKGMIVTGIRDQAWGTAAFVYDQKEQLIQATRTGIPTVDFAYDPVGNLVASNSLGSVEDAEIGRGDMLLRKGGTHYRYDAQGRLVGKSLAPDYPGGPAPAWEYAWDALDQLRSVTAPDGSRWEYGYDPLGRRIFKRGPEGETRFRWDRDVVIHEERADAPLTSWIFDIHTYKPLGARREGKLFPVLTDHIGTPREMLDAEGAIAWSADFGPWGDLREEKGGDFKCPIRFQGQWHDAESGLHYNRWRYYDPAMRRYITPDPIGLRGGINLYRYCPNPVNWIDPSGLDWNYVLVDGNNEPYYSGVSTQDPSQVESRHANNIGNDGQPRLDVKNGDRLIPITPIDKTSDNHDTARGLEQRVAMDAKEGGTVIGRQGDPGNNKNGGSVHGNNQNPVSPDADNAAERARLAQEFLDKEGKTVKELIEEGIKKKDEAEEACKG